MISPEVTTEVISDNENEDEVGEENYQTSEEENISNTCRSKIFPELNTKFVFTVHTYRGLYNPRAYARLSKICNDCFNLFKVKS